MRISECGDEDGLQAKVIPHSGFQVWVDSREMEDSIEARRTDFLKTATGANIVVQG